MGVSRVAVAWAMAVVVSCGLLAAPLVVLAATSAVTIQNSAFNPPSTPVRVGEMVTWTNRDAFSHTATSDGGAWDTGVITTGASRSSTFMNAGTFAYHCAIHAFMKGTVTVVGTSTPSPQPPPPTVAPTPVRTAPPTVAPTEPSTAAPPTESATAEPVSPTPSASATQAAAQTIALTSSPSPVAVQVTPAPTSDGGPAPLLIGAAVLAIAAIGAIAFVLARRA
jgi:plastocyanin